MNQVPSVTLQTAVLMIVSEFAQNNQQFSVHDITRTIRQKTANGDLEIPEVEVTGASFRFDIPHAKVKALFDELWRTGVFDPNFTLNRNFNGMYFEYTPTLLAGNPATSTSPTPAAAPAPAVNPHDPSVILNIAPSLAATPIAAVASALPADIQSRVKTYLDNCANRNFRPTLKQVQSAIKRGDASTGFSCEVLKAFIANDLGLTIVDDPGSLARAQVATV